MVVFQLFFRCDNCYRLSRFIHCLIFKKKTLLLFGKLENVALEKKNQTVRTETLIEY